MKASWAGIGTLVAAALVLALFLSPSAGAQGEPSRVAPPAGRYEVSWRALTPEAETVVGSYTFSVDNPDDEDDDRVLVSLATFGAAVTVVLVGSAGYLLRRRFGLVKPPPEQGPEH